MATPSPFNRGYSGGLAARNLPMPAGFTSTPPQMQPPLPPSPMGPMDSPANRSYGGGLAGRPAVPVGRSSYDLNRIAQQQFRRTKDPSMLLQMDTRNRYYPPVGGWPSQQAQPQPRPMQPPIQPQPGGRFIPGISPGAQVWVPDAPSPGGQASAPAEAGTTGAVPSFVPPPLPAPQAAPAEVGTAGAVPSFVPPPLPAPMRNTDTRGLLPLPWESQQTLDITKPLPPSTLGGGTGVPPPPDFQVQNVGSFEVLTQNTADGPKFYNARVTPDPSAAPFIPTVEQVQQFNLQPDFSKMMEYNGKQYPSWKTVSDQPMETVTINPDGTERRSFKRPMGQQPAPAPAATPTPAATAISEALKRMRQ